MKDLKGTIKRVERTEVQRIEGYTQAPQFIINERVYHVYKMEESYVTTGVKGEHHTLDALVASEFSYSEDGLQWFDLHMDYHANTWTLTQTKRPEED